MAKASAHYTDGFIIVVPKKNIQKYKKMALFGKKLWMEHGAVEYRETVGDDLKVPFGLNFTKVYKTKPTETIIFSWITFKSKAHRNSVNKKVMKDPRMAAFMDPSSMPFDVKKMSYGGFKIIVSD